MNQIKPRVRRTIINALRTGVVPKIGLQYIQVGRYDEINAIQKDLEIVADGGSATRFIVGDFGSGKTFFLTLASNIGQAKNLVTTKMDLSNDQTLYSTGHKARSTFTRLIKNLSTKSKSEGALTPIIEGWLSDFSSQESQERKRNIAESLAPLKDLVAGHDFIDVLNHYVDAYLDDNEQLRDACVKWLSGEFKNKTEAKKSIPGITSVIGDTNYYDYLKLYASFFAIAGYGGFLVCIDELESLMRLRSTMREKNFENILKIVNDSYQGNNKHIMFMLSGTPELVFKEDKGLYSYGALKTRLSPNRIQSDTLVDFNGPVIELNNLRIEEYIHLFAIIHNIVSQDHGNKSFAEKPDIDEFAKRQFNKLGAKKHMVARDAIKEFIGFLDILTQNPGTTFKSLMEEHLPPTSHEAGSSSYGNTDL